MSQSILVAIEESRKILLQQITGFQSREILNNQFNHLVNFVQSAQEYGLSKPSLKSSENYQAGQNQAMLLFGGKDLKSTGNCWAERGPTIQNEFVENSRVAWQRILLPAPVHLVSQQETMDSRRKDRINILGVGDSTMQGLDQMLGMQQDFWKQEQNLHTPSFEFTMREDPGKTIGTIRRTLKKELRSSRRFRVVILKGILDVLNIYAAAKQGKNWKENLLTYVRFVDDLMKELQNQWPHIKIVSIGPHHIACGRDSNPQDPLGVQMMGMADHLLSSVIVKYGATYLSLFHRFEKSILAEEHHYEQPHQVVINGIHLTQNGQAIIAASLLEILVQIAQ